MNWFSSDFHFNHLKIIGYCNRPFNTVEQMDETIIANLNQAVAPNDNLYFLGDFVFAGRNKPFAEAAASYRDRINCRNITLIWGNHDRKGRGNRDFMRLFNGCYDILEVDRRLVLCHYALRTWNKMHHSVCHLYAHSHGTLPDDPYSRSFDAGVDCWGFRPFNDDDVDARMAKKLWKPIDHHKGNNYEE